jgi:positive regulator of sigma E activity
MIEDIGRVVRVTDDRAFIEVEQSSACASCGLQEAEELAAGGKVVFEAYNMAGANIGDRVRVQVRTGAYVKASLYVYGIPVLFLVIGAVAGAYAATILNRSPQDIINVINVFKNNGSSVLLITHREEISLIVPKTADTSQILLSSQGEWENSALIILLRPGRMLLPN